MKIWEYVRRNKGATTLALALSAISGIFLSGVYQDQTIRHELVRANLESRVEDAFGNEEKKQTLQAQTPYSILPKPLLLETPALTLADTNSLQSQASLQVSTNKESEAKRELPNNKIIIYRGTKSEEVYVRNSNFDKKESNKVTLASFVSVSNGDKKGTTDVKEVVYRGSNPSTYSLTGSIDSKEENGDIRSLKYLSPKNDLNIIRYESNSVPTSTPKISTDSKKESPGTKDNPKKDDPKDPDSKSQKGKSPIKKDSEPAGPIDYTKNVFDADNVNPRDAMKARLSAYVENISSSGMLDNVDDGSMRSIGRINAYSLLNPRDKNALVHRLRINGTDLTAPRPYHGKTSWQENNQEATYIVNDPRRFTDDKIDTNGEVNVRTIAQMPQKPINRTPIFENNKINRKIAHHALAESKYLPTEITNIDYLKSATNLLSNGTMKVYESKENKNGKKRVLFINANTRKFMKKANAYAILERGMEREDAKEYGFARRLLHGLDNFVDAAYDAYESLPNTARKVFG